MDVSATTTATAVRSSRTTARGLFNIIAVAVVFSNVWSACRAADAIKCYYCTITPPSVLKNETARLCANFDRSDRYVVECPHSTMCMKRTFGYPLRNQELVRGTVRGCASQLYKHQVYVDGQWRMQSSVEEPYEEGCQMTNDKGALVASREYCFCRGDLCNTAADLEPDVIAVIIVYNIVKYMRSL